MSSISTQQLADVFVEFSNTLIEAFDLVDFLDRLTSRAAEVSGADAVGLLFADHHGQLQLMAASQESARVLELFVIQRHEGPCFDCFSQGQSIVVPAIAAQSAIWPGFASEAVDIGFRSSCALPMRHQAQTIGVLGLFSSVENFFPEREVGLVQGLAHVATIALLQERAVRSAEILTEQLQGALNSRIVVEQAKGVLAQREAVTVDDAFVLLREYCRAHNLPLGDVSQAVVRNPASHTHIGQFPAPRAVASRSPHRGL